MEDVEEYIAGNRDLRQAVGLAADAALEVVPLGKGEHNENFMLTSENGARSVLRVNRLPQPFHDNQVAYEFAALKALEPSCCVPRALYLDDSARAPGKGVLVESFYPGEELNFDRLKEGDHLQAFVYTDLEAWSDTYCYFDCLSIETSADFELTLTAQTFDADWNAVLHPIEGAIITVNGNETEFVTDAEGKVVIDLQESGEYVISAVSDQMTLVPPVCLAKIG